MPRTRNPYPADLRDQIITLARAGRSVESLAREFKPCAGTIADWLRQAVNYLIAAAGGRAGLGHVHLHMLRHSCGFALANKKHDVQSI